MLQNYIKIALRNLWKNKTFSGINIAGLALGIAAFVLILEYVSFEKNVNRFHEKREQIYRVLVQHKNGPTDDFVPSALAGALKQQFPEVTATCRLAYVQKGIVTVPDTQKTANLRSFREDNALSADGDFFRIFSFPVLTGSPSLARPNTVALSQSKARTYFGQQDPIGKVITLNSQFGKTPYTVVSVFADVPENSDIQFDMVYALSSLDNAAKNSGNDWARLDNWYGAFSQTVLLLNPAANPTALEQKSAGLLKQHRPDEQETMLLQPLSHLHLGESLGDQRPTAGKLSFVYTLGAIAFLILVIAWLNYINLSTAGSLKRAKEVGVRKVVGANRSQIIGQFLGESLLLNVLGLTLAMVLVSGLQKPFNGLVGRSLSLATIGESPMWLAGVGALLIGALLSGSYAAFVLSGFPVVSIVKNAFVRSGQGIRTRQLLVVFQFSISILLIIATVVLYRQLSFMQNQNLGMNLDQLLVIKGPEVGSDSVKSAGKVAFRHQIAQLPFVRDYCNSGSVPGGWYNFNSDGVTRMNPSPGDEKKNYAFTYIDDRFLKTYGIALAAGQNFTPEMCDKGMQAHRIILNERGAKKLGFSSAQDAVGQKIRFGEEYEIVGVVKDYHHQSLQQAIEPLIIFPSYPSSNYSIRLAANDMPHQLAMLEQEYKQLFPGNPFEYFFVDERYQKQYQSEQQQGRIFTAASAMAILIACLGLFGLAAYTAEQRTKEIGVRKVLGASVASIIVLLSRDFIKLVVIALVLASPLAWWGMNQWLQDFAYHITIDGWVFFWAGIVAIGIALLTVLYQSLKAAYSNPVKSLRAE